MPYNPPQPLEKTGFVTYSVSKSKARGIVPGVPWKAISKRNLKSGAHEKRLAGRGSIWLGK
jgi:hypothetical protein